VNNLLLLFAFWGFLGLTLYLLINMGDARSSLAAKKTFIIVGGSDALMLFGIGAIYYISGTFQMDKIQLSVGSSQLSVIAYICLAIACFAKAGAMPFHSWIPECAASAPVPAVAYLPASLDKLLGIYLLVRISLNMFILNSAMNIFLMAVGAVTIVAAVMMALVQHDMKRLLGYHAVSQVGYMVLGIGTGNPLGIAGGIFHMLNNAIYKSCLFLAAGNVENRAKTTDLDKIGGLARPMPFTYICFLTASLSISGVPPFNGFVSKWMIYQGLINNLQLKAYSLKLTAIVSLIAAMFGSGLTLASFMKLLHAVFLGGARGRDATEAAWPMRIPCLLLAFACVIFGVFAFALPLKYFVMPAVASCTDLRDLAVPGAWSPGVAALIICLSIVFGLIVFYFSRLRMGLRRDGSFSGGQTSESTDQNTVTGAEFYNTIKEIPWLGRMYQRAEEGLFDLYEQGKNLVLGIGGFFQYLHNGVLPTYLVWTLLGMAALFFVLVRR
jgi:formate hydrogenlyase subunit 3/multisubunit Na+/H+ antiporter MnhD subunit